MDLIKKFLNKNIKKNKFVGGKINLLIELDTFDKGGLQKVVLDSALRFDADLFNVTIVSINGTGYLSELATKKGIKVFQLPAFNKAHKYKQILQENNIHLSNSHFSNYGYPFFKKYRIPNITFIHNVYAFLSNEQLKNFIDNDIYVDLYISVSSKATRYAVKNLGIRESKIVTIPNGLILEEHLEKEKNAEPLNRKEFGLLEDDYVFINPASYNLHKGHFVIIDAMKKVLKVRNDIKILCIGNIIYKPHYLELTNYLKSSGLDKYILMPGYFTNIESIYPIVDAFLMPSFIEGWSIAMNEAMFYKKPMIMTDTGGASDVIENNDIGILLENEYGDISNLYSKYLDDMAYNQKEYKISTILADAMLEFASNRDYWKIAGQKGRDKIIKKYDFNKIIKKYEDIFVKTLRRETCN